MSYVFICAVLSAVFAGMVPILAKIGIKGVDSNLATTIRVLMLAPILCALVFYQGTAEKIFKLSSVNWVFLFFSALASGLSWLFYFYALSKKEVTWLAPIDKSSLAFTFILGVLILGEKITWQNVTASVLVLAALGVTLIRTKAPGSAVTLPAPTIPMNHPVKP